MYVTLLLASLFLFFTFLFLLLSLYYHFFFSRTSSIFLPSISLSYFPFISLHHFILYTTIMQNFQQFSSSLFITMEEFSLLFLYRLEMIFKPRKAKICQKEKGWNSMKHSGIQTSTFPGVSMLVWWPICYISPKWLWMLKKWPKYIQNLQINLDTLRISKMIKIPWSSKIPPKPLKWSKYYRNLQN